jgi:putative copper export protein
MDVVRFLHVVALAFFVGGQLMLVAAVVPGLRAAGATAAMRPVARRFGIGSLIALGVLVATGAAMAADQDLWDDGTLQVKLGVVLLVGALTALHLTRPQSHVVSAAIFAASLVIVGLGVALAH